MGMGFKRVDPEGVGLGHGGGGDEGDGEKEDSEFSHYWSFLIVFDWGENAFGCRVVILP
jgi:hypothetical protein